MKLRKALVGVLGLFTFCNSVLAQQADSLDITFNPGTGATYGPFGAWVGAIGLGGDGKVIIAGNFHEVNGQSRNYIARLNPDGGVDETFLPLQGADAPITAVEVAPDGKVYIGGDFGNYNNIPRTRFARLRQDGSLDLDWPDISFNGPVIFIKRQLDGGLLTFGGFSQVGGVDRNHIARLNPDASLDLNFNPGVSVSSGTIKAFALQPDGKIVIAGDFSTNNPVSRKYVARVTASGALDSTFDAGPYIDGSGINAVALQGDGKVIVAGPFSSINGYSRLGIARLNTNGTLDMSFVLTDRFLTGGGTAVNCFNILPDGKILMSGNFSSTFVRLNPDGSYDSAFASNPNDLVLTHMTQPDGKILVGGWFTAIAGTNINRIARLNGTSTNAPALQFPSIDRYAGMLISGTVSNTYRVEWTTNPNTASLWTPLMNITLQTNPQFVLDPNPISGRQRDYRAIELP